MKKTKEMYPGCLYLFQGQSSSSSCFIQSEEDAKSFMVLANLKLRDYVKIHEYNLHKDSWSMIVSLRSRGKIFKSYKKARDNSKSCDRSKDHTKIWKIISEQMRQFLKQYVTEANRRSGREGVLVKGPYKRFYFECKEEAQEYVIGLRKQLIKQAQKLKKYRGRKRYFKIRRKKIKGHIFLCSGWKSTRVGIEKFFRKMQGLSTNFIAFVDFMALKIIERTINCHT